MRLRWLAVAGCALLPACVAEAGAGYGSYSYGPGPGYGGYAAPPSRPYYREPPPYAYDADRPGDDGRRGEQERADRDRYNRDRGNQERANQDRGNQERARQQQQQQAQQPQRQQQMQQQPPPRGGFGGPDTGSVVQGNGPP